MRQGQQNKRMRGRGRKVSNPLNRIYESNGPDVKVRGTANHVAEKYLTLARDAQASGDPVSSENYLQHAEHYLRIIAAAQTQNQPQQRAGQGSGDGEGEMNGAEALRGGGNGGDSDGDSGGEDASEETGANAEPAPAAPARGRRRRTPATKDDTARDQVSGGNRAEGKGADRAADDDGQAEGGANGSGETPEAVA